MPLNKKQNLPYLETQRQKFPEIIQGRIWLPGQLKTEKKKYRSIDGINTVLP